MLLVLGKGVKRGIYSTFLLLFVPFELKAFHLVIEGSAAIPCSSIFSILVLHSRQISQGQRTDVGENGNPQTRRYAPSRHGASCLV